MSLFKRFHGDPEWDLKYFLVYKICGLKSTLKLYTKLDLSFSVAGLACNQLVLPMDLAIAPDKTDMQKHDIKITNFKMSVNIYKMC